MRIIGSEPGKLLLPTGPRKSCESAADGVDRQTVDGDALLWSAEDAPLLGRAGPSCKPKARRAAHAAHGTGSDLSETKDQSPINGA